MYLELIAIPNIDMWQEDEHNRIYENAYIVLYNQNFHVVYDDPVMTSQPNQIGVQDIDLMYWFVLHLFNDDTRPQRHISRLPQVGFSQSHVWLRFAWFSPALTHLSLDKMVAILADDIVKCIFLNENVWISITISLNFVHEGPINIIPALVQIMAWQRPGDKPLSELMMIILLTHICATRHHWVKRKSV